MENKKPFHLDQAAFRMVKEPPLYSDVPLNTPQAVVRLLADTFKDYDREVFAVVNLRPDLKPVNLNIVSIGALDQAMAHPREIMKSAILSNAASILLAHNHTTGNLKPSREDIQTTDRISQICTLMGIKLTDHVIIGPGDNYYSFHENSEMPLSSLKLAYEPQEIKLEGMKVAETANMEKKKQTEVSFTVAECSEFHNMGELHENISTVKEAIEIFKQIPPDRMNGIPAIGIRLTDQKEPELFTEVDIVMGKSIDMEVLDYMPEIKENKSAQFAIAEMLHAFPEAEVKGKIPEEIQKKIQIVEAREKQAAQLETVMNQLETGVKDVFNSDTYKNFLNVMAKMPRYSVNNQILIAMQSEGKATMCQSFTGWKEMGRYVKKGEKGLKILAPAPYTIQTEQNKVDKTTGQPVLDADGEPVKETKEVTINAFKVVSTFDISQTDGKELPTLGVNELVGNIEGYGTLMQALKEICPVPINFENIESGAKGYYHQADKRIAIQDGMSEVQTVKTAIHEMAHQKLHAIDEIHGKAQKTRESKEVEAESVAYVVCQHLGINTSDYSIGYVAGWSDGKELPELKASLHTIRNAAAEMITAIDEKVMEILKAQEKKITLEDITNIKGISDEYYPAIGQRECKLSCEIKGEPNTITYLVQRYDDGEGFTLNTEGTDIWDVMSPSDLRKLETIVNQEVEIASWQRGLAEANTLDAVQNLRYGLMETENSPMTVDQIHGLMNAICEKEELLSKESTPSQDEAKTEKKPSVKKKLQTKKETAEKKVKASAKKIKTKELLV